MPIRVACPACNTTLTAPDTSAGKTVKCPKCQAAMVLPAAPAPAPAARAVPKPASAVVPAVVKRAVPARTDDEDEDRPRRKRPRDEEDDEDDDRPRSKRNRDDEDEDYDDRPKRRKSNRKKSGSGGKVALIIGGAVALLLLIGGGVWLVIALTSSPADRFMTLYDNASDILETVKDAASAEAAKPKLVAVGKSMKAEMDRAREEAKARTEELKNRPIEPRPGVKISGREVEQLTEEAKQKMEKVRKVLERHQRELMRVQAIPGGPELLRAYAESQGNGFRP